MSIKINGRQLEITSTIRDWVGDRLKALSEDSVLKTTQVNATLEREKSTFRASLVLNCKYHTLTAEVTGPDLGRVFESGARKLEAQARSLRDKIRSHKADGLAETEQAKAEEPAAEAPKAEAEPKAEPKAAPKAKAKAEK